MIGAKTFELGKNVKKNIFSRVVSGGLAAVFAALLVAGSVVLPQPVSAAYAYPSTHAQNVAKGWGHVEVLDDTTPGEISLRFFAGTQFAPAFVSCFEYRTDGDTSQALATANPNPAVEDRYPHLCVSGSTVSTDRTFDVNNYIEIRSAFGPESDERFDWTTFALADNAGPEVTFTSPAQLEVVGDTTIAADFYDQTNVSQYSFNITGPKSWSTKKWTPNDNEFSVVHNLCEEDRLNLCDEDDLPSGTYKAVVAAYDGLGNRNISTNRSFVLDKDGPTISITDPVKNSTVTSVLVDGSISDQKLSFFNMELKKVGDPDWNFTTSKQFVSGPTHTLTNFDILAEAYYGTCDGEPCVTRGGGNLPSGDYSLRVNAYDEFGNRTFYTNHTFSVDVDAPLAIITGDPSDGDTVSGTVDFVGEVTDDNPKNSYFRIEGPSGFVDDDLFTDGRSIHNFSWDTTSVPDGEYKIYFETRDQLGNKDGSRAAPGDSVDVMTLTVDNTAPVVTLDDVPDSSNTTPTLTGTVDDPNADVFASINGGAPEAATNNGDGTWTYIPTTPLTIGDYNVVVSASDAQGNVTNPEPTDDFSVTLVDTGGGTGTGTTGGGTTANNNNAGGGDDGDGDGGAAAAIAFQAAPGADAGAAADAGDDGDGQVQGDNTDDDAEEGNVEGESAGVSSTATTNQDASSAFNYWWLLIIAAILAAIYAWYRKHQNQADQA